MSGCHSSSGRSWIRLGDLVPETWRMYFHKSEKSMKMWASSLARSGFWVASMRLVAEDFKILSLGLHSWLQRSGQEKWNGSKIWEGKNIRKDLRFSGNHTKSISSIFISFCWMERLRKSCCSTHDTSHFFFPRRKKWREIVAQKQRLEEKDPMNTILFACCLSCDFLFQKPSYQGGTSASKESTTCSWVGRRLRSLGPWIFNQVLIFRLVNAHGPFFLGTSKDSAG